MATAKFAPCPHCQSPLSYLCGVSGTRMDPPCPRCGVAVPVDRPTFLMADNSTPASAELGGSTTPRRGTSS